MAIKVLMLLHNLRVSAGVSAYVMNYYRSINHDEVHIDFALWQDIPSIYYEEVRKAGSEIYILPSVKKIGYHIKTCKDILSNRHYDIIHDNSLMITYPMMMVAQDYVKIRILHSHSARIGETFLRSERNKIFKPLLLRTANYYAACTSNAGKALFGNAPFTIIPNVINVEKYKYNEHIRRKWREEYQCNNKLVVGCVGRLTDAKNPFFAIEVIEELHKINEKVELWWIGSGVLDKQISIHIQKKQLEGIVKLFGSRDDVNELYQAIDVFFLPSKSEGFGLSCLEAQTAGLPCVVSSEFPREVNVTNTVRFIQLKQKKDIWVAALNEAIANISTRQQGFEIVKDSVYSASSRNNALVNLYKNGQMHL